MILYTPWPMEELFSYASKQENAYQELEFGGAKLLVEQTSMDKCKVVRLLSTDPQDFMKAEFQPGAELTLAPRVGIQQGTQCSQ